MSATSPSHEQTERRRRRKSAAGRVRVREMIRRDGGMGQQTLFQAAVVNLTKGSILCRTNIGTDPYVQMALELMATVDDREQRIYCEGTVMRCDPVPGGYDTAIQLTDFAGPDRDLYAQLVEDLPPYDDSPAPTA